MTQAYSPGSAHTFLSIAAFGVLALSFTFFAVRANLLERDLPDVATIAIEHTQPLLFSLTMSAGESQGIAELSHRSAETIRVSVPESWTIREVRGTSLHAITKESASFGLNRYTLPANAVLSFMVPSAPAHLRVLNPTGAVLSIEIAEVHLDTGVVERETVLVKDKIDLW
jgi:hypothetical protein